MLLFRDGNLYLKPTLTADWRGEESLTTQIYGELERLRNNERMFVTRCQPQEKITKV